VLFTYHFLRVGIRSLKLLVYIVLHTPREHQTQETGSNVNQYFTSYVPTLLPVLHPDDELQFFETPGITHPRIQHHILEVMNLQHYSKAKFNPKFPLRPGRGAEV
jgi:hypothetical protein